VYFFLWSVIVPKSVGFLNNSKPSLIALCFFYGLYFLSCFCISGFKIMTAVSIEQVNDNIKRMKLLAPKIWFSIDCYHYVTRVTTSNEGTSRFTYRVDSYAATKQFNYTTWEDVSGDFKVIEGCNIYKVSYNDKYIMGDYTSELFKTQKKNFIEANCNRDNHYDAGQHFKIEGLDEHTSIIYSKKPFWFNVGLYLLCSLLGFSWFYLIYLERKCISTIFNIRKEVTL